MENALGLVMTGGGARGAYQVGILKRIGEIKRVQTHGNPFPIIGGSSAGAINGAALAVGSDDFALATKVLARVWSDLRPSDVFRCDVLSQAHTSLTWILARACSHYVNNLRVRCKAWNLLPSSTNEFRIACRCSAATCVMRTWCY